MADYKQLVIFALILLLLIAGCFVFAYWQVDVSQHHWCDALNTLTQNKIAYPADPAKNPSRVEAYDLYSEFARLKGDFGCD